MNLLIFSFRGEVAQGAQFALPQVVVQVGFHKKFFSCSRFLVFGIFAVLSLASIFCSKILKEKNKTILNVLRFSPEAKSFHFSLD